MNVFHNVTEKKTKQLCYEKGYKWGWRELKSFYLAFAFYMRIDQDAPLAKSKYVLLQR